MNAPPFDDYSGPPALGSRDLLTEDEATVGAAYLRLMRVLQDLNEHPFARHLYTELQDYLETQAWEAAEAFERLQDLGPQHLSARLTMVRGYGPGGEGE